MEGHKQGLFLRRKNFFGGGRRQLFGLEKHKSRVCFFRKNTWGLGSCLIFPSCGERSPRNVAVDRKAV